MRSTFITSTAVTVALFGIGAAPAMAHPRLSEAQVDAANHAATMLLLAAKHERDAESVVPAPPQIARVVRVPVARDGFDWVDGSIGAGLTGALLLGAAGLGSARRHAAMVAS
jgi:hypothetical protein